MTESPASLFTAREAHHIRQSIVGITHGSSSGTGFFVLPGLVLTCDHVLDDMVAELPEVEWRDQKMTVTRVHRPIESYIDLAAIEVAETRAPSAPYKSPRCNVDGVL